MSIEESSEGRRVVSTVVGVLTIGDSVVVIGSSVVASSSVVVGCCVVGSSVVGSSVVIGSSVVVGIIRCVQSPMVSTTSSIATTAVLFSP